MEDPRLKKLADVLVRYSTAVQPDDLVRLSGPPVARPLLVALCRAVLKAGGHPHVRMVPDECAETMLEWASEEQLRYEDPLDLFAVERIDVSIRILGQDNTKALTGTDPGKQALVSQGRKKQFTRFLERAGQGKLRWVTTQFPCQAAAQDAQMSLAAYERFVFGAGLLELDDPAAAWRQISQRQQRMTDHLNGAKEVRFTTPQGTDLRVGVEGRTWINCDGKENFPDGEIFTSPVEDSLEGWVRYSYPAIRAGREVDGVELTFEGGRVVKHQASKGEVYLTEILNSDAGASYVGEWGIGTNYDIRRFTKNMLFDEKMGGTIHLALGHGFPETESKNESALHWDMLVDLADGEIVVDGDVFYKNGEIVV